jgi:hypothetical protein
VSPSDADAVLSEQPTPARVRDSAHSASTSPVTVSVVPPRLADAAVKRANPAPRGLPCCSLGAAAQCGGSDDVVAGGAFRRDGGDAVCAIRCVLLAAAASSRPQLSAVVAVPAAHSPLGEQHLHRFPPQPGAGSPAAWCAACQVALHAAGVPSHAVTAVRDVADPLDAALAMQWFSPADRSFT